MRFHPRCVVGLIVLSFAGAAHAGVIADLAGDYKPAAYGQTSDGVGIPGTLGGSWHYYQDTDRNPANGNAGLLTYQTQLFPNFVYGDTYAGTEYAFNHWYMPMIAAGNFFNDVGTPPLPAGAIMGHPGTNNYLAVEYRAGSTIENLSVEYSFLRPKPDSEVSDVYIAKGDGTVVLPITYLGATSGTVAGLGTLNSGDSIWLMLGSSGGFAGDTTFMSMKILGNSAVPEPSAWLLAASALALLGMRRRSA